MSQQTNTNSDYDIDFNDVQDMLQNDIPQVDARNFQNAIGGTIIPGTVFENHSDQMQGVIKAINSLKPQVDIPGSMQNQAFDSFRHSAEGNYASMAASPELQVLLPELTSGFTIECRGVSAPNTRTLAVTTQFPSTLGSFSYDGLLLCSFPYNNTNVLAGFYQSGGTFYRYGQMTSLSQFSGNYQRYLIKAAQTKIFQTAVPITSNITQGLISGASFQYYMTPSSVDISSFSGSNGQPIIQSPLSAGLNIVHQPVAEPDWIENANDSPITNFFTYNITVTSGVSSTQLLRIGNFISGSMFSLTSGTCKVRIVYDIVDSTGSTTTSYIDLYQTDSTASPYIYYMKSFPFVGPGARLEVSGTTSNFNLWVNLAQEERTSTMGFAYSYLTQFQVPIAVQQVFSIDFFPSLNIQKALGQQAMPPTIKEEHWRLACRLYNNMNKFGLNPVMRLDKMDDYAAKVLALSNAPHLLYGKAGLGDIFSYLKQLVQPHAQKVWETIRPYIRNAVKNVADQYGVPKQLTEAIVGHAEMSDAQKYARHLNGTIKLPFNEIERCRRAYQFAVGKAAQSLQVVSLTDYQLQLAKLYASYLKGKHDFDSKSLLNEARQCYIIAKELGLNTGYAMFAKQKKRDDEDEVDVKEPKLEIIKLEPEQYDDALLNFQDLSKEILAQDYRGEFPVLGETPEQDEIATIIITKHLPDGLQEKDFQKLHNVYVSQICTLTELQKKYFELFDECFITFKTTFEVVKDESWFAHLLRYAIGFRSKVLMTGAPNYLKGSNGPVPMSEDVVSRKKKLAAKNGKRIFFFIKQTTDDTIWSILTPKKSEAVLLDDVNAFYMTGVPSQRKELVINQPYINFDSIKFRLKQLLAKFESPFLSNQLSAYENAMRSRGQQGGDTALRSLASSLSEILTDVEQRNDSTVMKIPNTNINLTFAMNASMPYMTGAQWLKLVPLRGDILRKEYAIKTMSGQAIQTYKILKSNGYDELIDKMSRNIIKEMKISKDGNLRVGKPDDFEAKVDEAADKWQQGKPLVQQRATSRSNSIQKVIHTFPNNRQNSKPSVGGEQPGRTSLKERSHGQMIQSYNQEQPPYQDQEYGVYSTFGDM